MSHKYTTLYLMRWCAMQNVPLYRRREPQTREPERKWKCKFDNYTRFKTYLSSHCTHCLSAFFCFQHLSNYLRRRICMDAVTNHLRILQIPVLELLWLVDGRQSMYENAQLFMIWKSICGYLILALHLVVEYNTSVYFNTRLALNSLFTHL